MIIHTTMLPLYVLTVLIGAGYMAFFFRQMRREQALQQEAAQNEGQQQVANKIFESDEASPSFLGRMSESGVMALGALIGAVAGFAGPSLIMLPLSSCTFEAERTALDIGFGTILFLLGAGLLVAGVRWGSRLVLDREAYQALTADQTTMGVFRVGWWVPTLLLLPTIIILVVFLYYPLIDTFRLSTLLVRLGAPRTIFRCVDNFTELLNPTGFDAIFWVLLAAAVSIFVAHRRYQQLPKVKQWTPVVYGVMIVIALFLLSRAISTDYGEVLFSTFLIASSIVIFGLILGLIIAYLAYQPVKGAQIYRTLLIWPYAMSPAIAGIIFFVMFDPVAGVINHIIELLGGQGVDWIRDPWLARFAVIVTSVWKTLGYNILFYIAGLQTIPSDLVEAAAIDGANGWQRFRNIIIPALSPITFFLIVTNLTYAFFNIFGTIDFLTRGGPTGATSVAIYEVYQLGIRSKDLGGAAAQSLVLFMMVIGVTVFQFRTSGRRVTYGA